MQCLMGGWWGEYSFRCQPVDRSSNPTATRVSPNDNELANSRTKKNYLFLLQNNNKKKTMQKIKHTMLCIYISHLQIDNNT